MALGSALVALNVSRLSMSPSPDAASFSVERRDDS
jgi:hypothetical protein